MNTANEQNLMLFDPTDAIPLPVNHSLCLRQMHIISRAAYDVDVPEKRILSVALKALEAKPGKPLEVVIKFTDIIRDHGLTDSKSNYTILRNAVKSLATRTIRIETEDEEGFIPWLSEIWIGKRQEYVRVIFHEQLRPFITDLITKKNWASMDLIKEGKLKSYYAIRIYELLESMSGKEGKEGNLPGEWFYYATIDQLRDMFQVSKYAENPTEFRRNVVTYPCNEINSANIGFLVTPESQYKGRALYAIKFVCKRNDGNKELIISEKTVVTASLEREKLINLYPDKYAAILDSVTQKHKAELDSKIDDFKRKSIELTITYEATTEFESWVKSQNLLPCSVNS